MYTTCSLTVTVSSSWLSATVVKPEKPTQKKYRKKKEKVFHGYFCLMILPGLPTTVAPSGTSLIITAPAPMKEFVPISLTPVITVDAMPQNTFSLKWIDAPIFEPCEKKPPCSITV